MRTRILTLILTGLAVFVPDVYAQPEPEIVEDRDKLAQTGMQFLTVPVGPRAAALAGAVTAQGGSSTAMFYNPAGMALMDQAVHISLGQNRWITDIGYNHASLAFRPASGRFGTFGVSVLAVDYGEIQQTIRAGNTQGYEDVGTYSPSAMAVGFGYARALTDRFSVGANVKYVSQTAGTHPTGFNDDGSLARKNYAVGTAAVDFGILYQTGFRSLAIAMDVRNFSRELTYAEENFELPLLFQVGVAMNVFDFAGFSSNTHSFLLSVDAAHPRSYVEQIKVGGEYTFMNIFDLRAGYTYPTDEQGMNLGVGLHHAIGNLGFGFDYGYTQFGAFGSVHRIGVQLSL